MFYDNLNVSTQIFWLYHVHTQVHTLKDMSSHTFCFMEMYPSTVWHLVFHYFDWCEGTINATFTLWTLLGCVYVQLLTYEEVSACITLTLSTRLLTNFLLKRARTHVLMFFLRRRIYIPFCHMRLMSVSRTFQLLLLERITFDIQGSVLNILSWPTCLHASSSTKSSVYAYVLSYENALLWLERTDYDTFSM